MKKLCSKKGETILETLVALLIIVCSFVFLVQAIVVSSRINALVKKENVGFTYFDVEVKNDGKIQVDDDNMEKLVGNIELKTYSIGSNDVIPNIVSGAAMDLYSVRKYDNSDRVKYFTFSEYSNVSEGSVVQ